MTRLPQTDCRGRGPKRRFLASDCGRREPRQLLKYINAGYFV
jgi:hypothetical protein